MIALVRRAGQVILADDAHVVWSVADGRRGRRWRALTTRVGALEASVLLEVGLDGRPSRLELATAAGLMTLHPEAPGLLHGNVVSPDGVRHLAFAWGDEHELEVEGQLITTAVTAGRLARSTPVGEGRTVPVVVVSPDLSVRERSRRYVRVDQATWQIDREGDRFELRIDGRAVPIWPGATVEWPLEIQSPP
jgi:hypothetical protein